MLHVPQRKQKFSKFDTKYSWLYFINLMEKLVNNFRVVNTTTILDI